MNITRTTAQQSKGITISVPSLDSEKVVDTTWSAIDTVEKFAGRSGYALIHGVGGAIPLVGYNLSKHIRKDFANHPGYANSFNQATNAVTGVAQVAGMAVGGAAIVAGIAGYSGAETIGMVAGGIFGVAGLSAMLTTYGTENLNNLTGDFAQ